MRRRITKLTPVLFARYPSAPGRRTNQELNAQVVSQKWYPAPRPAAGSTVSVINGLHSVNGGALQAGAITINAATKYLRTMVMSDTDENLKETTATQIFSDGARELIFTAVTKAS